MSAGRIALTVGVLLVVCVLAYLRQIAKREREWTVYGSLFAVGIATVGVLLVNVGMEGLHS